MGIFYKYKQGGKLFDPEGDGEKSAGYEIYKGDDGKYYSRKKFQVGGMFPGIATTAGVMYSKAKGTKLNPKNWGVDEVNAEDFGSAYQKARAGDMKEFIYIEVNATILLILEHLFNKLKCMEILISWIKAQ